MSAVAAPGLTRLLGPWQTGEGTATARLADAVADLVVDGRLGIDVRLPAERDLARHLGVSRTTVTAAYGRLRERGFLASRQGAGSWTRLPADAVRRPRGLFPAGGPDVIDLGVAAPEAPVAALLAAGREALEDLPAHLGGHGYVPAGLPALRAAVAERYTRRGLPTDPEQVLVTSGGQNATVLLARVLVGARDPVLLENPTYPNARDAFAAAGARLVPVGIDPEGLDVAAAVDALRESRPRLAYVVPDFHNPTGALLDEPGRGALALAARSAGTQLVVDETLVDLGLDDVPLPPPVAALAPRDAPVVTIGSLTKAFWGGLRVGWVRAPRALVSALAAVRASVDLSTPVLDQLVAVRLLEREGEVLAERRAALRDRRAALTTSLARELPAWRFVRPPGGLSLWVALPQPRATRLAAAARRHGVHLVPGPDFGLHGTLERYVRVPYALPAPVLVEAVHRLAAAEQDVCAAPGTPGGLLTA